MINLDCMLKSRNFPLPKKVSIVKTMFFPVVMYRSESWTIKKSECQKIGAFKLWCWRCLWIPWTARRWNQSIVKEINPEYLLDWLLLKLKLQSFGHLMWRANSLEKTLMLGKIEGRRRRKWQRMKYFDGIIQHEYEFQQNLGYSEGQRGLKWYRPWGCKKLNMSEWLNNSNNKIIEPESEVPGYTKLNFGECPVLWSVRGLEKNFQTWGRMKGE